MWRLIVVVAVSSVLLGCAASKRLEQGLNAVIGMNISTLVYKWGYPNSERKIMGKTIYVWKDSYTRSYVVPQKQTTKGTVGYTRYSETTTTYITETINVQCVIEVIVDDNDIIQQWQVNDKDSCNSYASRL